MNLSSPAMLIGLGAAVLIVAACATTPEDRIARERELFESFPPEVQQNLRAGVVEVGYTEDMVRIALGEPDRIIRRTTEDGDETVYSYVDSRPAFSFGVAGTKGGGRSSVGTGVGVTTGGKVSERLAVVLRDGAVVAIEERTE